MIRLEELTKAYGDHVVVDHVTLEVPEGDICVLVGPSGSGKTTTLRMVNRLVEPTSGRLFLEGDDVTTVDPVLLRRRIGYVIQQVGLFPHRTVADNVATVPNLLGWDRARIAARVEELLTLVGLDPGRYARRYPHQLSGGQRQRVGVARALGADPPVLLMDEPFGAIDPITRGRLQEEFRRLQQDLGKTVVFVTHDVEEAIGLGDRIAILAEGGVLAQYDTPAEILTRPASAFVADFVGADRGLKRLSVSVIDVRTLDRPPVVAATDTGAVAAAKMAEAGADRAVVVDGDARPLGLLDADAAVGQQPVSAVLRAPDAVVEVTSTLKDGLAAVLTSESGWGLVVDGGRYVGVLTPDSVHRTLRRAAARPGGPPADG